MNGKRFRFTTSDNGMYEMPKAQERPDPFKPMTRWDSCPIWGIPETFWFMHDKDLWMLPKAFKPLRLPPWHSGFDKNRDGERD